MYRGFRINVFFVGLKYFCVYRPCISKIFVFKMLFFCTYFGTIFKCFCSGGASNFLFVVEIFST